MERLRYLKSLLLLSCLLGLSTTTGALLYPEFRYTPTEDVQMPAISNQDLVEAFSYASEQLKNREQEEDSYLNSGNLIPPTRVSAETAIYGFVYPSSLKQQRIREQFEDATKYIGKKYQLTEKQINLCLPKLSLPEDVPVVQECRNYSSVGNCDADYKYRTSDGSCNNIKNPNWARAYTASGRMTNADYADGLMEPRTSKHGYSLPNARVIASVISPDIDFPSKNITHLVMNFGEWMSHDSTNVPICRFGSKMEYAKCCPPPNSTQPPPVMCYNLDAPENDFWHDPDGKKCMPFVRSIGAAGDCKLGTPRQQIIQVTSTVDLSMVYGNSDEEMRGLRTLKRGLLRAQDTIHGELPIESPYPTVDQCTPTLKKPGQKCFWAGDFRICIQPGMTVFHTLCLRQHNKIARMLSAEYPEKTDEEIFQEARRIVGSQMQVIGYKEYLPIILGPKLMKFFQLEVLNEGYTQYNSTINPMSTLEMVTGANRFGHSLIQNIIAKVDSQGRYQKGVELASNQQRYFPAQFYDGELDFFTRGMFYQQAQESDRFYADAMGNHMLQGPKETYGLDLRVLEIQRGREHGLPSYIDMVNFCFNVRIDSFDGLNITMKTAHINLLRSVYRNVSDVDYFIGGLLERPVEDGLVGLTFACIIGKNFQDQKNGDRFFFEHENQAGSYTKGQLQELRKTTLAGFFCDTSDNMGVITPNVFFLINEESNPLTHCSNISTANFSKWFDK